MTEPEGLPRIVNGNAVFDPFTWLESTTDASRAWLKDQEERPHTLLGALPGEHDALGARIRRALAYEARTVPLERGWGYLFLRSPPDGDRFSLWVASAPGETGREILHPACLDQPEGLAEIGNIWPSPDGRHAVLAVTHGGRQRTQLVVIALQADGPATILERLETPSFAWASWHDEKSFFWTRRIAGIQLLALRSVEGVNSGIEAPCDTAGAGMVPIVSDDGNWLVLLTYSPGVPGCRLFAAVNSSAPDFVEVGGFDSEDLNLAGWQSDGLVLVPRSGGGHKIMLADLTPLRTGGLPVLRLLHRDGTGRLSSACALANGDVLLIDRADDGGNAFRHLSPDGRVVPVEAGGGITWGDWTLDRNSGRLLANLTCWNTPSHLVAYDPAPRAFTPLRQPAANLQLWTGRAEAVAEDGTRIPVTLLKPQGMANERDLPCLLWGYGGFGISIRPQCMMSLEPWFAAGGMVAIAHGRGGGELGPAWHDAGKGVNKLNSFTDFIAVARWLVASGRTSARRLCLWGASAGGLLVLSSAVMAPDCCGAVIAENPVTDMAKFTHYDDDGRYWTVEFGDPAGPEALAAIARWSPLHNLKQGGGYPATLITVARNDERVSPVHGRKMAAALQATGSIGPHLLLELGQAGHAGHATVTESAGSRATLLRFAAWATGLGLLQTEE